ncbi:trihelix transcription factor ASIL1 [Cocos nucifera]|uniref:Trihelix transcription factor ASIL1 n=1 Tax=Cocos nucifera TaxID=13894 RepID=A0A8K0NBK4_COCNU|nr:trihelix transcription factor ASIL1 [Cocos nucifera]
MDGRETAPSRPPNPALPYREDCWSEGETSALVEAWGDHYLELNRGNLRQKHWQEVADAVNSRRGASASRRPPRTDVQCKNRIDTLKKKYKIEKARVASSDGVATSQWAFYERLDALIGSSVPAKKPSPPLALPLPYHRKGSPVPATAAASRPADKRPVAALAVDDPSFFRRAAAAAAAASAEDDDEEEDSGSSARSSSRSGRGWRGAREGNGDGIRQLARAITRFAEIYERVERAKQRQMMELEKQRMEFAKGLEFQRMQIFVDSQVQLEKIKRAKRADSGYGKFMFPWDLNMLSATMKLLKDNTCCRIFYVYK